MNTSIDSKERHTLPAFRDKLPGNFATSGRIGVKISEKYASTREGQLLLWMTCNLIVRLKEIIKRIELVIPDNIGITEPNFIPFNLKNRDNLRETITEGTKICSRECEVKISTNCDFIEENDAIILLGHDTETNTQSKFSIRASSNEWLAYVGRHNWHPPTFSKNNNNPFGAFSAACIAVGDVFKFIGGLNEKNGAYSLKSCFSSYDFSMRDIEEGEAIVLENPSLSGRVDIGKLHIVGAGAVAHSVCHSLYAIPEVIGKLIIIDRKTNEKEKTELIDDKNLNRYVMASRIDINKPKGQLLAEIMNHKKPSIDASGFDESFETYVNTTSDSYFHVLSCIDTNRARHAIQDQIPRIIHGGSTYEMRIQTSLYELAKNTQCLKCYNPIASDSETDKEVIERLRSLSPEEIREEARKAEIDPKKLSQFLKEPQCGILGNESIQKFAKFKTELQASVSFVSAMSGFMLAAELIKFKLNSASIKPILNCEPHTDFFFNFWYNMGNLRPTKPNENCWCSSGNPSPRAVYSKSYTIKK